MNRPLHVLIASLATIMLCSCSSAPKDDDLVPGLPRYEDYRSSATYDEKATPARELSSVSYEDDDYGSSEGSDSQEEELIVDSGSDNLALGDEPPRPASELMAKFNSVSDDEEELEPVAPVKKPSPAKKKPVAQKKKPSAKPAGTVAAGMYTFKSNCQMRSTASLKAKSAGSVSKGKKLWVEPHDKKWGKVYKKSGAVYVPRSCF